MGQAPKPEWRVVAMWEEGEISFKGRRFSIDLNSVPREGGFWGKPKSHTWHTWFDALHRRNKLDGIGKWFCKAYSPYGTDSFGRPPPEAGVLLGFSLIKGVRTGPLWENARIHNVKALHSFTCDGVEHVKELQTLQHLIPTGLGQVLQEVIFDNPTRHEVEVYWVDHNQKEHFKFKLRPAQQVVENSVLGHKFIARMAVDRPGFARTTWIIDGVRTVFVEHLKPLIMLENGRSETVSVYWKSGAATGLQEVLAPTARTQFFSYAGTTFTFHYASGHETYTVNGDPSQTIVGGNSSNSVRSLPDPQQDRPEVSGSVNEHRNHEL